MNKEERKQLCIAILEDNVKSIVLDDNIKKLRNGCFSYRSFNSITIPNSVKSFGNRCFIRCDELDSITIPNSVMSFGNKCFYGCSNLSSVTFEEPCQITELPHQCFYECHSLSSIKIPSSVMTLGHYCLEDCSSLQSITIPNTVTVLNDGCINSCSSLTNVIFEEPCQITELPYIWIGGCTSLTSITIPNSVKTLGYQCFKDCSLTSITIPNNVENLQYGCFNPCLNLSEVIFEEECQINKLPDNCFKGCSVLTEMTIPSSIKSFGRNCFDECSSLQSITMHDSFNTFGSSCFRYCTSLESITIPSSIKSISNGCFYHSGLKSILIPNTVTSLEVTCFMFCEQLNDVVFEEPCQIKTLPSYCFSYCSSLESITIPSSITSIDARSFQNCSNLQTIYVDKPTDSITGAPWGATNATVIWNDTVLERTLTINPTPNDAIVSLTAEGFEQNGNSIMVTKGTEVDWEVSAPLITYYAWDAGGFDGGIEIEPGVPDWGDDDFEMLSTSDLNHDVAYTLTPLPTTTDPMYFLNTLTGEYEIDTKYVPSETSDSELLYTQRGHYYHRNAEKDVQIPDAYFTQFGSIVVDEDTILDIVLQKALLEQNINVNASSILWSGSVTTQVYVDGGMEAVVYQEDKGQGDYSHTVNVQLLNNRQYEISNIQFTNTDNYQPSYTLPIALNGEDVDLGIWWGNCCVPSDSIIKLVNGETKLAKDVMIGDIVFGYDFDKQEIVSTEVSKVSYPNRDHIIEVTLSDETIMRITKDHAIYTNDGWASYCPNEVKEVENTVQLTIGQSLLNDNNDMVEIVDIKYVEYKDGLDCVNLTTSTENYFANGYLVHNAGCRGDDEVLNIYITSK